MDDTPANCGHYYEAMLRLNRLKAKYGVISKQMAEAGEQRLEAASEMIHHIDDILSRGNYQDEKLSHLKAEIDRVNAFPVSGKAELELPVGLVRIKPLHSLWSWLTER